MTTSTAAAAPVAQTRFDRAVGLWLLICATMILAMAVIGAITRLTESGLSIMEWAPVAGALPPLSEAEWQRMFALYQQIPEYQEINRGMSLAEFKTIFWWEYIHRLWGRLIGVVFAVPFFWFLLRRRLRPELVPHLVAMFVLGGLQGALGWYMVASGFAARTDVSQYRLVAHLAAATAIYAYILWVAFGLLIPQPAPNRDARTATLRPLLAWLAGVVALTMAAGGFVAGLDAGFIYNTFPLMDGRLVPADYGDMQPWIVNLFENVAAVQFNHRALATLTAIAAIGFWLYSRRLDSTPAIRAACALVLTMTIVQFALGVAALVLVVPVWLGALHQAGAFVLLGLVLLTLRILRNSWSG
ncbi:MAG: COX15/CtaA family protein [Alphaproteobacteria bacterium]